MSVRAESPRDTPPESSAQSRESPRRRWRLTGAGDRGDLELPGYFSQNYAQARQRFVAALRRQGWRHERIQTGPAGASGEELSIDVGISVFGSQDSALIISSGVHGVEGFLGSALQLAVVDRTHPSVRPRIVLIHALNPYGFAWSRRVNENNIDVNRNFMADEDFSQVTPNADYERLSHLFYGNAGGTDWLFYARSYGVIARQGLQNAKAGIARGQYHDAAGLFYGGSKGGTARDIFRDRLTDWVSTATRIRHLDFHTGAGPWGRFTLLAAEPQSEALFRSVVDDPRTVQPLADDQLLYKFSGGLHRYAPALVTQSAADYRFAYAELGTYPALRVIAALRAENLAHRQLPTEAPAWKAAKARLREIFCPADLTWRQAGMEQGLRLVTRLCGDNSVWQHA